MFGSYEGLRQQTPVPITLTMPTVAEREGDFSRTFNGDGTPVTLYDPFQRPAEKAESWLEIHFQTTASRRRRWTRWPAGSWPSFHSRIAGA